MAPEQLFGLLLLVVATLATAIIASSMRSYWRKLRAGPHLVSGEVSPSWFRPLVRR
jgi:hypothetical protein